MVTGSQRTRTQATIKLYAVEHECYMIHNMAATRVQDTRLYVCARVCAHVSVCTCVCKRCVRARLCVHVCARVCTCAQLCVRKYVCARDFVFTWNAADEGDLAGARTPRYRPACGPDLLPRTPRYRRTCGPYLLPHTQPDHASSA